MVPSLFNATWQTLLETMEDFIYLASSNFKRSPIRLFTSWLCLSSIRTNEVGCERFFRTAGCVSCPRRTRLNVRNYECLSMLKVNMKQVFIDEEWVTKQYMMMEKDKSWDQLQSSDDLKVLKLEQELLAESLGVSVDLSSLELTNLGFFGNLT